MNFSKITSGILFCWSLFLGNCIGQTISNADKSEWEIFPIINYDTDVGFGFGAKGYLYNFADFNESFDITIYNSTKGERWYQLYFSYPDIQRRQGRKYNFAVDLVADYDKYINYLYYPTKHELSFSQNSSKIKNEKYIREPIEIKAIISRAFTEKLIAEAGIQLSSITCYNFEKAGILQLKHPTSVEHISYLASFRFDSRENFINPKQGILLQLNNEYAEVINNLGNNFFKTEFLFQTYFSFFDPEIISATRLRVQKIFGLKNEDYQNLIFLGGNNSLRGLPQSRYLSLSSILVNQEIRFHIWKRISGIAGIDVGNSPSTPHWIINPVTGLRFNMDNFIVRFDVGFSKDNIGIYFNFGQLF